MFVSEVIKDCRYADIMTVCANLSAWGKKAKENVRLYDVASFVFLRDIPRSNLGLLWIKPYTDNYWHQHPIEEMHIVREKATHTMVTTAAMEGIRNNTNILLSYCELVSEQICGRREKKQSYVPRNYRLVKLTVHLCDVHSYVDRCSRYLTYLEDLPAQEILFHRQ